MVFRALQRKMKEPEVTVMICVGPFTLYWALPVEGCHPTSSRSLLFAPMGGLPLTSEQHLGSRNTPTCYTSPPPMFGERSLHMMGRPHYYDIWAAFVDSWAVVAHTARSCEDGMGDRPGRRAHSR